MNFSIQNSSLNPFVSQMYTSVNYVGDYKFSSRNLDINNWLVCDGRSLSRTDYPELFGIISTSFGSPSATTFNIPDFRGKVFGPVNNSHPLGQNIGTETVTLTIPEMPIHNHTATIAATGIHTHSITDPGHSHQLPMNLTPLTGIGPSDDWTQGSGTSSSSSTTGITILPDGNHSHNITIDNTGGSLPHNNMQPTLFGGNVLILSRSNFVVSTGV